MLFPLILGGTALALFFATAKSGETRGDRNAASGARTGQALRPRFDPMLDAMQGPADNTQTVGPRPLRHLNVDRGRAARAHREALIQNLVDQARYFEQMGDPRRAYALYDQALALGWQPPPVPTKIRTLVIGPRTLHPSRRPTGGPAAPSPTFPGLPGSPEHIRAMIDYATTQGARSRVLEVLQNQYQAAVARQTTSTGADTVDVKDPNIQFTLTNVSNQRPLRHLNVARGRAARAHREALIRRLLAEGRRVESSVPEDRPMTPQEVAEILRINRALNELGEQSGFGTAFTPPRSVTPRPLTPEMLHRGQHARRAI